MYTQHHLFNIDCRCDFVSAFCTSRMFATERWLKIVCELAHCRAIPILSKMCVQKSEYHLYGMLVPLNMLISKERMSMHFFPLIPKNAASEFGIEIGVHFRRSHQFTPHLVCHRRTSFQSKWFNASWKCVPSFALLLFLASMRFDCLNLVENESKTCVQSACTCTCI